MLWGDDRVLPFSEDQTVPMPEEAYLSIIHAAPELGAIDVALGIGVDFIELDVQRCADGQLVLGGRDLGAALAPAQPHRSGGRRERQLSVREARRGGGILPQVSAPTPARKPTGSAGRNAPPTPSNPRSFHRSTAW